MSALSDYNALPVDSADSQRTMRFFALSDIHVDYEHNARWVRDLSVLDYRDDLLILAGDISDRLERLEWCLRSFARRFRTVLFVPGNHELWVVRDEAVKDSFDKFRQVVAVAEEAGVSMRPYVDGARCIVPLLGWYDFSFGPPTDALRSAWMDFFACRWPEGVGENEISEWFSALNPKSVPEGIERVITCSHFMPRIDLMPAMVPAQQRMLYPVLGSNRIDTELRNLGSRMHIYGHSHLNRNKTIEGVQYLNNAFGYPHEDRIASKCLLQLQVD